MVVDPGELDRRVRRFMGVARKAGVRLTHQRLEIFREVASSIEHPPVEVVHRAVRARLPTVSLDTVYRTLWMLEALGLVATLGPRRGAARFDANLKPHHHFVCLRCGLTRDFETPAFDALGIPGAVMRYGEVVATRVELRGLCRGCSTRRARATGGPSAGRRARRGRGMTDKKKLTTTAGAPVVDPKAG